MKPLRSSRALAAYVGLLTTWSLLAPDTASAQVPGQSIVMNVSAGTQRLEMVVNTSRILTLEHKIPRVVVNNPDVLELTPLSPNQVQVFAKKPGVTQVNLWDEQENVQSLDVVVFGDAQELTMMLKTQFPTAALKVVPLSNSVVVSGFVDRPEQVSRVIRIAEDYYPKVINNISVGGVQQVLLHVKVMEMSRTKLRELGFDFDIVGAGGNFVTSSVSGLISSGGAPLGGDTIRFGILNSATQFNGFLEALQQKNLTKILAEPTLVTVSGRPATFRVGGEFPILVPQSLGTVSIEYKNYGTQVDFVPIVMGNGRIRLEIRPRVSELDTAGGVTINNTTVPALTVREVDTGVEMRAGQTLALAGLIQTRTESENKGLPIISDLPYFGVPFRRVEERKNEIELLILVTPELVEAMDPHEVPPSGPGLNSSSPTDWDLYMRGHLEVANRNGPMGMMYGGPAGGYAVPTPTPRAEPIPPGSAVPPQVPAEPVPPTPNTSTRTLMIRPQVAAPSRRTPTASPQFGGDPRTQYNRFKPSPSAGSTPRNPESLGPGFIGPVGYDVHQ